MFWKGEKCVFYRDKVNTGKNTSGINMFIISQNKMWEEKSPGN